MKLFTLLTAATLMFGGRARASLLDANFTDSVFITDNTNLGQMTGIGWAPDGSNRLFVTRKTGQVMIIQNGAVITTPFATFSPYTNSECGLIGFAFDPSFTSNGYIYFFVTISSSEQRIIRYTASGNTGTNPTIIMSGLPTLGQNHDGGSISFGPDGKLYWAIGDNGSGIGVNADLTSLAAKIGRCNRDGSLPADNPFVDGAGSNNDYIWGRGYRNPFTMAFQPSTGNLWMNVVGTGYEQIFVATKGGHAGYNAYENNQPAGYLTPIVKYVTNGSDTRNIPISSGAVRSGGVITITTSATHGFRKGEKITISGVTNATFNGNVFVASTPSATTFTAAQAGADATSGSGTAATQNNGGCITGGAFWESTAAPASYRGNFFFGDYNSGRLMRVILDGSNEVSTVDAFSNSSHLANAVDTAIGPDGAIYSASAGNGQIRRAAYNLASQDLIVTPTYLQTDEGGRIGFAVRLAIAPASNVSVSVARTSGDANLTVFSGSSLTFTPANYAAPQAVILAAAQDADATNDAATFTVSSAGLTSQSINLTAVDDDIPILAVTSTTLGINEGSSGQFGVYLTGPPTSNVTVSVSRTAGDSDITVSGGATLNFNASNFATPQQVTIAAAEDADPTNDTATISVQASGFTTQSVSVTVTDNDSVAPAFASSPILSAVVNAPYSYDADASGTPAPTYSVVSGPSGLTIHSTTGVVSWTPSATGTFAVTLRAQNGVPPAADQSFSIAVAADQAPVASMTRPYADEIVSGTNAEWFGDGSDDVGCTQAKFYVDDNLVYTDSNTGNHYHFGGAHLMWNTTTLADGEHTLKMIVVDTAGQPSPAITRKVIVANTNTPLEAWRKAKFTNAELADPLISGNKADPEGDGHMNLMEYALGLNPKASESAVAQSSIPSYSGVKYLTLTYRRPIGGRPNLNYNIGVSDDLLTWNTNASATTLVSINSQSDGKETVIVRDNTPVTANDERFIRLQVPSP